METVTLDSQLVTAMQKTSAISPMIVLANPIASNVTLISQLTFAVVLLAPLELEGTES